MKRKISTAILSLSFAVIITGCTSPLNIFLGAADRSSSSNDTESYADSYSDDENETGEEELAETSDDLGSDLITPEILGEMYSLESDYNYEYLARGYVKDLHVEGAVRDVYVPYDPNFTQDSVDELYGKNHGVSIRASFVEATAASEALELVREKYMDANLGRTGNTRISNTQTEDNDTVGLSIGLWTGADGTSELVLLYADIKDPGDVYLTAIIEIDLFTATDESRKLLSEIEEHYAIDLTTLLDEMHYGEY